MSDERIQDVIDYCCGNPDGLDTEELLGRFPEYREQLVPLLALCNLVNDVPRVPAHRYEAMKQRVMSAAVANQAAQTTQVSQVAPARKAPQAQVKPRGNTGPRLFILEWLRRPALAAGVLALLLVSFVWSASASSLPDSPFYNVKILGESFSLNFADSPAGKARRHAELAEERLADLQKMGQQHKLDQAGPAFSDYNKHLQQGQDLLNGISTGDEKNEVAGLLYRTCRKGQVEFSSFGPNTSKLPASVRQDYEGSATTQNSLARLSENVLIAAKIPPISKIDRATLGVLQQTPGPEATRIAMFTPGSTDMGIYNGSGDKAGEATDTPAPGEIRTTTEQSTQSTNVAGNPSTPTTATTNVPTAIAGVGTSTQQPSQSGTAVVAGSTAGSTISVPVAPAGKQSETAAPPVTGTALAVSSTSTTVSTATVSTATVTVVTVDSPTPEKSPGTATQQPATTNTAQATQPLPAVTERPKETPTARLVPPTPTTRPALPTPTPRPVRPTVTPALSVQPTASPEPTGDPPSPPTHTPKPTNTPKQTQVPPSNTPVPATNTNVPANDTPTPPLPTATPDDGGRRTRTPEPEPTATTTRTPHPAPTPPNPPGGGTQTPKPVDSEPTVTLVPPLPPPTSPTPQPTQAGGESGDITCKVSIKNVDASCASATCVNWTAQVENKSGATLQVDWTAQLEVKAGSGGYQVVATDSGTANVGPGRGGIRGKLCYNFPPDARNSMVNFAISVDNPTCDQLNKSKNINSCGHAADSSAKP